MKHKIVLSALLCLMLTAVSCSSDSSEKSAQELSEMAQKTISDDYIGIISSSAKYSFTDSDAIDYRDEIKDSFDGKCEWMIIAESGSFDVYCGEEWSTGEVFVLNGESADETLEQIYQSESERLSKAIEDDSSVSLDPFGMLGYIEMSKKSSANSYAKYVSNAVNTSMVELDADGISVTGIERMIFESGKLTDIICSEATAAEEVQIKIEDDITKWYTDFAELPCVVVYLEHGAVQEVYWAEDYTSLISGSYPYLEENDAFTLSEILENK